MKFAVQFTLYIQLAIWEYAKGTDIKRDKKGYAINRMPLWIKPNRKVDVLEIMDFMRNHLEGTELDMKES